LHGHHGTKSLALDRVLRQVFEESGVGSIPSRGGRRVAGVGGILPGAGGEPVGGGGPYLVVVVGPESGGFTLVDLTPKSLAEFGREALWVGSLARSHVHVLESIHGRVSRQLPRVFRVHVLVSGDLADAGHC
jgi:hypothetical protein